MSVGVAQRRQISRANRSWHRNLVGWGYVTPAVFLIAIFSVISIIISFYISLTNWDVLSNSGQYVGLANYRHVLFHDDLFWVAARNTVLFTVLVVPLTTALALIIAVMINSLRRGGSIFRTIYFVPSVTPMVVLALIWIWFFTPDGLINQMLAPVHAPTPNWLLNQHTALSAVILMTVWTSVGYDVVIFSAALADIPSDLYEAAKLDGAGTLQRFWSITLPLLRNAISFVAVILTIGSLQVFTQVYVMTQGGPAHATEVVQALVYKNGFLFFHMGYAAAMSWLLFVVIFVLTLAQLRWFRSGQTY